MKRSVLTLMLAGLVICGCASRMNTDLLQARIREQSLQLTESQRETAKARAELKQSRLETDRLKTQLGQKNQSDGLPSRDTAQVSKVHIYSLLSGGINKDHQPGDDAVVVQFAPFDRDNEPVNVPGELEITLLDPKLPDAEQELGQWSFSEEECQKQWTRGIASSGYQFTLPLEQLPQHTDLVVRLTYTTSNNRRYETNRIVKVAVAPADVVAQNRKSRKKLVQVVDELDEDLPPVGDFSSKNTESGFDDSDLEEEFTRPARSDNKIQHSANWTDSTIPQLR